MTSQDTKQLLADIGEAIDNCRANGHDYPRDPWLLFDELIEHGVIPEATVLTEELIEGTRNLLYTKEIAE